MRPGAFTKIYTSPADAFPGAAPRPVTPDLNLRSFDVPDTVATHVRLVVVSNQCTGVPLFSDNSLDTDPSSNSDCTLGNAGGVDAMDQTVRAAELQVFSTLPEALTPQKANADADGRDPDPDRGVDEAESLQARTQAAAELSEYARAPRSASGCPRRPGSATTSAGRCRAGRLAALSAPTRARKGRPRCTRYVRSGSLRRSAALGSNMLRFQGRLTRRRALRPGRYRLTLVATDAAGQRSTPKTLTFRLLGRRR